LVLPVVAVVWLVVAVVLWKIPVIELAVTDSVSVPLLVLCPVAVSDWLALVVSSVDWVVLVV
jgi:hypothetical protein